MPAWNNAQRSSLDGSACGVGGDELDAVPPASQRRRSRRHAIHERAAQAAEEGLTWTRRNLSLKRFQKQA